MDRRLHGDAGCFEAGIPELVGRMVRDSDDGAEEGGLAFGQRLPRPQQAGGERACRHAEPVGDHGEAAQGEVLLEA